MKLTDLPRISGQPDALFGGSDRLALLRTAAHILVIDDEEMNLRLITSMLRASGYRCVTTLADPRQLEGRLDGAAPDLIVLDLHMPLRSGFDVLEALQPWIVAEHLPVIVVTGDPSIESRRHALSLGARDFLEKPFDLIELTLRVRNQLETRLLYQDVRKQNRALREAVHGRTQELEETRIEMLVRLAVAAEYRDDSTSRHTMRVGEMAARLTDAIELGDGNVALMKRAAALHDVGKVGIPDALLLKPTGLMPEETSLMRTHTTIGAHILGGSEAPLLQMAEVIALSHHERWDGLGYPQNLVGDAIPIAGRIVAVADSYDALTNDRPYRRALSSRDAIAEIEACRGTQFDPAVVDAFLRVMSRRMVHAESSVA